MVQYKEIPNYKGYRAGDDGSIWSCLKKLEFGGKGVPVGEWKILNGSYDTRDGRVYHFLIRDDGIIQTKQAAYYILLAFVGPCPDGMQACHNDGDCTNDALYNIRWDTFESNTIDRMKHRKSSGDNHYAIKILDDDVEDILERCKNGESQQAIADDYGVSQSCICYTIKKRKLNDNQVERAGST